jgi:hypothetical protein
MKSIKIGYTVPEGEKLDVRLRHLVATGITESGKTTALESWIGQHVRKGGTSIVFLTKKGEEQFKGGKEVPPYFTEKIDWEYVKKILGTVMDQSMDVKEAEIIDAVDTAPYPELEPADTLEEVHENIKYLLENDLDQDGDINLSGYSRSMYTSLNKYFEKLIPRVEEANFSTDLEIQKGELNIMDLRDFDKDLQSMIIAKTLETIYYEEEGIRVVLPEAWKFLPQHGSSIVKEPAVQFIREGGTNDNYLTIDSQDLTRVDKEPLKQVKQWALGLQMEKNEVKRARDQMPVPKKKGPTREDIMSLPVGQFYFCQAKGTQVDKVYIQPAWMEYIEYQGFKGEELAIEIAKGNISSEQLKEAIEDGEVNLPNQASDPGQGNNTEETEKDISDELEAKVSNLQDKVEYLEKETNHYEDQLEQKKNKIEELKDRIEKLNKEKKSKDKEIERLRNELDSKDLIAEKKKKENDSDSTVKETILGKDKKQKDSGEPEKEKGSIEAEKLEKLEDKIEKAFDKIEELEEELDLEFVDNELQHDQIGAVMDRIDELEEKVDSFEQGGFEAPADDIFEQSMNELQEEAIDNLTSEIEDMKMIEKKIIFYLETRGKSVKTKSRLVKNALGYDDYGTRVTEAIQELKQNGFIRVSKNGSTTYPRLKQKVEDELKGYEVDDESVENTYKRIYANLKEEIDK